MLKKTFRGIGRIIKPFVNFPVWMNWRNLKENNERLGRLAKSVLMPTSQKIHPETFEEAVIRLNLNESAIQSRQRYLKRAAAMYVLLAMLMFIYAVYLLIILKTLLGFITALTLVWVVLALAFRNHFWYIQMRERCLGLGFKEWIYLTFRAKREA